MPLKLLDHLANPILSLLAVPERLFSRLANLLIQLSLMVSLYLPNLRRPILLLFRNFLHQVAGLRQLALEILVLAMALVKQVLEVDFPLALLIFERL